MEKTRNIFFILHEKWEMDRKYCLNNNLKGERPKVTRLCNWKQTMHIFYAWKAMKIF